MAEPTTVEEVIDLLRERPDDAELYQQLGDLHFERRELMEAWQAYMQSLRLNPEDPWTCLKFGTLLTICDDKKYARRLFDYAIELAPELAVAHWCSANLYREQGEYELAERAYERAVEVDPDDEQAREKLAEWLSFIARVDRRSP
jgi:cytochrome c-type biogenesis protein CcmH/NrfG